MPFSPRLDPADPTPLYAQLERAIRLAVATGQLTPGEQLPTVRQLAVDLRVNANTVARVYAELERAGLLEARRGVGTRVATPAARDEGVSAAVRAAELDAFARRVAADASALGFDLGDVALRLSRLLDPNPPVPDPHIKE